MWHVSQQEVCWENAHQTVNCGFGSSIRRELGREKGERLRGRRGCFSGRRAHDVTMAWLMIWLVLVQRLGSPAGNKK